MPPPLPNRTGRWRVRSWAPVCHPFVLTIFPLPSLGPLYGLQSFQINLSILGSSPHTAVPSYLPPLVWTFSWAMQKYLLQILEHLLSNSSELGAHCIVIFLTGVHLLFLKYVFPRSPPDWRVQQGPVVGLWELAVSDTGQPLYSPHRGCPCGPSTTTTWT